MLIRLMYMLCWVVIGFPTLLVACYQKRDKLWDWAYYFDNDEEGFDGSGAEWYDNYLGIDIDSLPWYKHAWISYKWSALRNACYNLRYHPKISYDVTNPQNIKLEGNTIFHGLEWMPDKDVRNTKWYKMTATYEGKEKKSWFYLIPTIRGRWIYIRFGLKIYPRHYFDNYWLGRIDKEGFPTYKRRGLDVFSIRVKRDLP